MILDRLIVRYSSGVDLGLMSCFASLEIIPLGAETPSISLVLKALNIAGFNLSYPS